MAKPGSRFWAIRSTPLWPEVARKQAIRGFLLNLESAVEQGFVGNLEVPGKATFAVNGYSINKNDNTAGYVWIFQKSM
ncbi:MAG: hypothetical protein KZQ62_18170 [Candidatus Thiodiazotropha sp. (ex Lucinoma aequizonata)]|nr:hypothetical protein [Candidatus Thiodiazotropha sp. (ex Lucinoma aequizonata)]